MCLHKNVVVITYRYCILDYLQTHAWFEDNPECKYLIPTASKSNTEIIMTATSPTGVTTKIRPHTTLLQTRMYFHVRNDY